jgi:hypothetical protein
MLQMQNDLVQAAQFNLPAPGRLIAQHGQLAGNISSLSLKSAHPRPLQLSSFLHFRQKMNGAARYQKHFVREQLSRSACISACSV